MEDSDSEQDVPHRVLDMVRMFLAASTRGDHAVLTLETRNKQLITKYRSAEKNIAAATTILINVSFLCLFFVMNTMVTQTENQHKRKFSFKHVCRMTFKH